MPLETAKLILSDEDSEKVNAPDKLADLPIHVRMFWANLTPDDMVRIAEATAFISELSAPARKFLKGAKPETLAWLEQARPEEIKLLNAGIDLTRSSQTMGRVLLWIFGGAVAAFAAVGGIVSTLNAWRNFKG